MKSIKYELKYCERCGTLKLRPVSSASNCCRVCAQMLARFRFPRGIPTVKCGELAVPAELGMATGNPPAVTCTTAGRVQ